MRYYIIFPFKRVIDQGMIVSCQKNTVTTMRDVKAMKSARLYPRTPSEFMTERLKNFFVSRDISGRRKCREEWPSVATERAYNLFLDGTLLLIPLLLMSLAYSLIAVKLWRGLKLEIRQTSTNTRRRK
jgi:hypothetical protein